MIKNACKVTKKPIWWPWKKYLENLLYDFSLIISSRIKFRVTNINNISHIISFVSKEGEGTKVGLVSISTFLVDGQSERQMLETEIIFLLHFLFSFLPTCI